MIYGIGTDICDLRRIAATFERQGERFAHRVLSDAEFAVWKARSERWPKPVSYTHLTLPTILRV